MLQYLSRFGVSHGSRIQPGLTPKRLMELCGMNSPYLLHGIEKGNEVIIAIDPNPLFRDLGQSPYWRLQRYLGGTGC